MKENIVFFIVGFAVGFIVLFIVGGLFVTTWIHEAIGIITIIAYTIHLIPPLSKDFKKLVNISENQ